MSVEEKKWFQTWFDTEAYHTLYANRTESEASTFIESILQVLDLKVGAKVADMACGSGRHARALASLGLHVYGYDLSEKSLAIARSLPRKNIQYTQHDMRLPMVEGNFDAVFSLFTSLGYFDSTNEDLEVLGHVYAALKEGGYYIIDYLNPAFTIKNLIAQEEKTIGDTSFEIKREVKDGRVIKTIGVTKEGDQPYEVQEMVRLYTSDDWKKMAAKVGFEVKSIYGDYGLGSFNKDLSDRHILVLRKPLKGEIKCLNCRTKYFGKYCPKCGQKVEHLKAPFVHLITEFVADYFHFDNKFFRSIVPLLFKPSFLLKEFMRGRRVTYINPLRLYFFSATIFFLLFFSLSGVSKLMNVEKKTLMPKDQMVQNLEKEINATKENFSKDTSSKNEIDDQVKDTTKENTAISEGNSPDQSSFYIKNSDFKSEEEALNHDMRVLEEVQKFPANKAGLVPENLPEYLQLVLSDSLDLTDGLRIPFPQNVESLESTLDSLKQTGKISFFEKKLIKWKYKKYGSEVNASLKQLFGDVILKLPKLMFFYLPIFALSLFFLYSRKKFYLVEHGFFTLYLFSAVFVWFSIYYILEIIGVEELLPFFAAIIWIWMGIYFLLGLKYYYNQGWWLTTTKFLILSFFNFIVIILIGFSAMFLNML